jgi:glycosyltransferase involved in cell wall biosynthesis
LIIIPTYYRTLDLFLLFESLLRQLVKPIDVLVIDDTPTSEINDFCAEFTGDFAEIGVKRRYVKGRANQRSISVARNIGATLAKGDIVMYMDNDTMPCPDYMIQFWICSISA